MRVPEVQNAQPRVRARGRAAAEAVGSGEFAFVLFCLFILSIFLRLTARIPALGALHLDSLLAGGTLLAIVFSPKPAVVTRKIEASDVSKRLMLLGAYVLVTLPFVEWPGSVLGGGLENLFKAVIFYTFIVATVNSISRLKILLTLYVGCQVFRVLEPLYLHITTGYWGSSTNIGNWEEMSRLAGSPYDIINPNGLGFLVVTTLPLLHYICNPTTFLRKVIWAAIGLAMCYALILSASRSSFLGLVVLVLIAIWRSKHRAPLFVMAGIVAVVSFGLMNDLQRDRYVSIFSHDARGSATAEGRMSGLTADLEVAMRHPLFGHGLGTSREANANYRGEDRPSHNLYTEVAQELGFIGLAIFLSIIWAFVRGCYRARQVVASVGKDNPDLDFLDKLSSSLLVLVMVYIFFSLASYGLLEPYWYIIGGLSVVTAQLATRIAAQAKPAPAAAVPAAR